VGGGDVDGVVVVAAALAVLVVPAICLLLLPLKQQYPALRATGYRHFCSLLSQLALHLRHPVMANAPKRKVVSGVNPSEQRVRRSSPQIKAGGDQSDGGDVY
jgi:hypothetical protein